MTDPAKQPNSEVIAGRNSVMEALKSGRPADRLLLARGDRTGVVQAIVARCRDRGIPVKEVDPRKLTALCGGDTHQGVALLAAVKEYATVDDIFALAEERGEAPLLIIADELSDPHNLGAIVRTAEGAGAHGIVVPKRRTAGLTPAVLKAAAGALEYVPVARVSNLAAAMEDLKKRGVWIYALDMDGTPWCQTDFTGPTALVIGSEGQGVGRLVKEKCDFTVSLPMRGQIDSLNASVATGIVLYEAARQRTGLSCVKAGQ